ncbi:hypothetical protein BKA67DRAFT_655656 [Truncatella angustata]|uniref:Aminoglycoside phosphotransferase domain-containing protein n=1 Tax=Truncatella angustata TaxID=152316 RepID=A0A9P9A1P7_9PEZI|nr:uncharacterized protein BKA67DRAFT_655656 [Truncatella angustata]KAH6657381.1 hypothetical protein BKA67DRAFT_655656 [Truncatella angustata]
MTNTNGSTLPCRFHELWTPGVERKINSWFLSNESKASTWRSPPELASDDLKRARTQLGKHLVYIRAVTREFYGDASWVYGGRMALLQPMSDVWSDVGEETGVIRSDEQVAQLLAQHIQGNSKKSLQYPWGNIMVKEGHVTGLLDWEVAGNYPVCHEFVKVTPLLDGICLLSLVIWRPSNGVKYKAYWQLRTRGEKTFQLNAEYTSVSARSRNMSRGSNVNVSTRERCYCRVT